MSTEQGVKKAFSQERRAGKNGAGMGSLFYLVYEYVWDEWLCAQRAAGLLQFLYGGVHHCSALNASSSVTV